VHVYEAYWAPLTEGKVGLADVSHFLFNAGWSGIKYAIKSGFPRWMFGGIKTIKNGRRTLFQLLLSLLVLWSLIFMNAVITSVFAARILGASGNWVSDDMLGKLASDILLFIVPAVALAVGYGLRAIAFDFWIYRIISHIAHKQEPFSISKAL
jgi:hypothetical protein